MSVPWAERTAKAPRPQAAPPRIKRSPCWNVSSFDFHATLAGVPGPRLIRNEVIQVYEPRQKRLLAAPWMIESLHRELFPLDGLVGLIYQDAGHRHPRVCMHRIRGAPLLPLW